jgi:hypothetical protein
MTSFGHQIGPGFAPKTSLKDVAARVVRIFTREPRRPTGARTQAGEQSEHGLFAEVIGTEASIAPELLCPLTFAGAHCWPNRPGSPWVARRDCEPLNNAVSHYLLYDGPGPDARLVGVEYLVSDEVYRRMPADEKLYWHAHECERDAGLLSSPSPPRSDAKATRVEVGTLWGKVYRTWVSGGDFPRGPSWPFWSDTGELPLVLPPGAEAQLVPRYEGEGRRDVTDIGALGSQHSQQKGSANHSKRDCHCLSSEPR